jgi:hypothetical protein
MCKNRVLPKHFSSEKEEACRTYDVLKGHLQVYLFGIFTLKVDPCPGIDSNSIVPPSLRIASEQIKSPKPVPAVLLLALK